MTDQLPDPVRRAIDAAVAGDTDGFLAEFAESGSVDDWGRLFTGHGAIRGWSDNEFIGRQVTLDERGAQVDGPDVTVTAQVGGNGFNGPSNFVFTLDGDRVVLMRITG
ncbi:MAG TPA: nuclear transport factor 2 family protein [Pseudonocardiaceae bacterium]|nr:nuclear transport factor 2 family protein [Pseudonocardiaceae bacterium]